MLLKKHGSMRLPKQSLARPLVPILLWLTLDLPRLTTLPSPQLMGFRVALIRQAFQKPPTLTLAPLMLQLRPVGKPNNLALARKSGYRLLVTQRRLILAIPLLQQE